MELLEPQSAVSYFVFDFFFSRLKRITEFRQLFYLKFQQLQNFKWLSRVGGFTKFCKLTEFRQLFLCLTKLK